MMNLKGIKKAFKINFGDVTNIHVEPNVSKDIIVDVFPLNKMSPIDILIGGGLVVTGIGYMLYKARYGGAVAYYNAELKTLYDTGLIHGIDNVNDYLLNETKMLK